jgi:3-dehydroshikimate dehydratase
MKLSVFTDIFAGDFDDALKTVSSLGFTQVDLRSRIGEYNVDTLPRSEFAALRKKIESHGLSVACVASWGVNPGHGKYEALSAEHRRKSRENVEHLVELSSAVGCRHIRVYSLKRPQGPLTEEYLNYNATMLSEFAAIASAKNCVLVIENEPFAVTGTCVELADLMRRKISPSLKVNWDIVNGWRMGEQPWTPGRLDGLRGEIVHAHVKGARGTPDGKFASMALPGADELSHAQIFEMLYAAGFDGTVTIDPHYSEFNDADKLHVAGDPVIEVVRWTKTFLENLNVECAKGSR